MQILFCSQLFSDEAKGDWASKLRAAREAERRYREGLDSSIARGGQPAQLLKQVIAVNKLGDARKAAADVVVGGVTVGFPSDSLRFVPVCALHGTNVLEERHYGEPTIRAVDALMSGFLLVAGNSSFVLCRVEAGDVEAGSLLQHAPSGQECGVLAIQAWGQEVRRAEPGDLARLKVLGALPTSGHVLSEDPLRCAAKFKAQIRLVETCRETPVMSQGFKCILHLHHSMEELCEVSKVIEALRNRVQLSPNAKDAKHRQHQQAEDLRTNKKEAGPKVIRAPALALCVLQICSGREVPLEAGDGLLGQLSLRTDGGTIAVGSVAELPKVR
ncbi:SUP35 [Symbiodinium sp. CCMP2592]|nr:SUP35 [Symbiodinium sp. CCMP2592]